MEFLCLGFNLTFFSFFLSNIFSVLFKHVFMCKAGSIRSIMYISSYGDSS